MRWVTQQSNRAIRFSQAFIEMILREIEREGKHRAKPLANPDHFRGVGLHLRPEAGQSSRPLVGSFERNLAPHQRMIGPEIATQNKAFLKIGRRADVQCLPADRVVAAHIGGVRHAQRQLLFKRLFKEKPGEEKLPRHRLSRHVMPGQIEKAGFAARFTDRARDRHAGG